MEKEKKFYGLNNDYLFKKIFGQKSYLQQFLKEIFDKKILEIEYLDKELKKENKNLSYGICDFVLKTETGMILLELQNKDLKNIEVRIWMYLFKLYTEHWENKDYQKIKPIEVLLILNYPYQKCKTLKKFQVLEKDKQVSNIVKKIKEYNMKIVDYQKMREAEAMEMTFEQATSALIADAQKKLNEKENLKEKLRQN